MKRKIVVTLNKASIENAINELNSIKNIFPKITQEFLMEVAIWITDKANGYINSADLGSVVKDKIKSSWSYEKTPSGIKIVNNANREKTVGSEKQTIPLAILVEFGVGTVGQLQAHPNANSEGYEYNMNSSAKDEDGSWHFFSNEEDLDIPQSAIDWGVNGHGDRNRMSIYTRGAKGVWYAYNAVVDARTELAKSSGGEIGALWNKVLARYFK